MLRVMLRSVGLIVFMFLFACSSPEDEPITDERDACEELKEVDEKAFEQCQEQLGLE